ncbi:MAG: hypothetical protein R3E65_11815 [Steroidobacteraceae bacterium]
MQRLVESPEVMRDRPEQLQRLGLLALIRQRPCQVECAQPLRQAFVVGAPAGVGIRQRQPHSQGDHRFVDQLIVHPLRGPVEQLADRNESRCVPRRAGSTEHRGGKRSGLVRACLRRECDIAFRGEASREQHGRADGRQQRERRNRHRDPVTAQELRRAIPR